MLTKYHIPQFSILLTALLTGIIMDANSPITSMSIASKGVQIANLANGQYQFCTQEEPTNWQQGAGVCLIFTKTNHHLEGYYGYPHSDSFICIRGEIEGNIVTGKALAISFPMNQISSILTSKFKWDAEKRLELSQGKIARTSNDEWGRIDWIVFHKSTLNVNGLHKYSRPRMTPPSQLCNWNFTKN